MNGIGDHPSKRKRAMLVVLATAAIASFVWHPAGSASDDGGVSDDASGASARANGATDDRVGAGHARSGRSPELPVIAAGTLRLEGRTVDPEKRPIGGALVTLGGTRTMTSAADGSFSFDGLAAGDYAVTAMKGFAYGEDLAVTVSEAAEPDSIEMSIGPSVKVHVVDTDHRPIAGAKVTTHERTSFTDDQGTAILHSVDTDLEVIYASAAGHEKLRRSVRTSDDPTALIELTFMLDVGTEMSGNVVDEAGAPVAEAVVTVDEAGHLRSEGVTADAKGAFTIVALGGGDYSIHATSSFHIAAPDQRVHLDSGVPKQGVIVHVISGATLSGVVTDTNGAPVAQARVTTGAATAESDAKGMYEVTGLAADSFEVAATTPTAGSRVQKVSLAKGEHATLNLTVVASNIAGIVVDSKGVPVENVSVVVSSKDADGVGAGCSDAAGKFDTGGLPPGNYEVEIKRSEQARRTDGITIHAASGTRNLRIVVPELASIHGRVVMDGQPVPYFGYLLSDEPTSHGGRPTPVRDEHAELLMTGIPAGTWAITIVGPTFIKRVLEHVRVEAGQVLELGDIVVEQGGELHGHVVDGRGSLVAGALVQLSDDGYPSSGDETLPNLVRNTRSAHTDEHGAFTITGLAPVAGPRTISATHPTAGIAQDVEVSPQQVEIELALTATGSIDGVIRGGVDVGSVYAKLRGGGGENRGMLSETPDAIGAFRFEQLVPGDYEISMGGDHAIPPARVTVTANARAAVEIDVPDLLTRLTLVADGKCQIMELGTAAAPSYALSSCSEATAVFEGVPPGAYIACVDIDGCVPIVVPAQTSVTLAVNQPLPVPAPEDEDVADISASLPPPDGQPATDGDGVTVTGVDLPPPPTEIPPTPPTAPEPPVGEVIPIADPPTVAPPAETPPSEQPPADLPPDQGSAADGADTTR